MLVIYHDFEGNLPFTGILQEVYGLPYATSTQIASLKHHLVGFHGGFLATLFPY